MVVGWYGDLRASLIYTQLHSQSTVASVERTVPPLPVKNPVPTSPLFEVEEGIFYQVT